MTTTRETSTRLIDVDDANALISYQGTWHWGTKYSVNTQWGSAWYNSLSVLSGNGSVAFSFTGSFHASKLPSWTCYLDGNAFPSNNISLSVDLNNVEICSSKNLALEDTPRHLAVVASGTVDTPFMFDHIQYEPDASIILDNATVVVDAFDVHIEYSSGWSSASDIGMETSVQGSFLNFDFVVSILYRYPNNMGNNSRFKFEHHLNASAQYSIDNGTLFPFTVFAQNSTVKQYNIASFDSPILSPGLHRLFVQYGVDNVNSSAPLFLDYLLIQNVTGPLIPPNTTTMATTQRPTGTPGPVFYRAGLSKGAITGVAVGSVAGLVLITFGLIWTIRFVKTAASLREPVPYIIYRDVRNLWRTKELNSTALTARGAFI
ncbi:hypothetical protein M413DRAFT_13139 [Hebeloma cylindrosporum]|uniref:Transmembrane protein n=1 Tax=Hebeloma cylindrosporum TaxID=76867 RepID=A0A0C3BLW0_HEBCY|nr:hypothetical protein M413DRAFT_13139 [Hebeloma cylindrosporum h7]